MLMQSDARSHGHGQRNLAELFTDAAAAEGPSSMHIQLDLVCARRARAIDRAAPPVARR
jgi:hypothetical protein